MKGHRIGAKQKIGLTVSFVGTGIVICGLNGAGKSTLGKALAEKLDFYFIDNEDLFFPKTDPNYIYASPRTREEAEKMLFHAIKVHENFVFAAVKGDYGEASYPFFQYGLILQRTFGCNGLKSALFRSLAIECCQVEICMNRKKSFSSLLHPDQRVRLRNGYSY